MAKNMQTIDESERKVVKDCMTSHPETITPDTSLKDAASKMSDINTGSLPVCNEDEKVLGFVTDRDIAIKGVAEGMDPEDTTIDKIMNDEVLYCYEVDELEDVTEKMKENKVLRLVVYDENKKFVGVITHSQIAEVAVEEEDESLCKKVAELACYDKLAA